MKELLKKGPTKYIYFRGREYTVRLNVGAGLVMLGLVGAIILLVVK